MRIVIAGDHALAGPFARRCRAAGHDSVRVTAPVRARADRRPGFRSVREPTSELAPLYRELAPHVVVQFDWPGGGFGRRSAARRSGLVVQASLRAAADSGARRFVLWSCSDVYRRGDRLPIGPCHEDSELANSGPSGQRARTETDLIAAASATGIRLVLLRASLVPTRERLSLLVRAPILPRGNPDWPLQLLHPTDALAILARSLQDGQPGIYNAAADGVVPYRWLARAAGKPVCPCPAGVLRMVAGLCRRPIRPDLAEVLRWLAGPVVLDNARLKSHFGYRPRFSSRQTLAEMLAPEPALSTAS